MGNLTLQEIPKQRSVKCSPVQFVCLSTERVS